MKPYLKYIPKAVLIVALLQSCTVTKDYKRPELQLPAAYDTDSAVAGTDTNSLPAYANYFKSRELQALIDTVIAHNPDLLIAAEQILAAQASLKSVKLNYLPDLNLQINAGVQRLSRNSMMGSFAGGLVFEDYNLAPALSWEIDFWGKLKRQREEALSVYLGQVEMKRALRIQLIAQTAAAYYNLLSLDEQLQITVKVEAAMTNTLELLQTQYSVGEVNVLALRQSEAQLAEVRALMPEIKAAIRAQENALQLLAGKYPARIQRSGILYETAFEEQLSAGVPADLLGRRPDVMQSELQLRAANARVGITKADFYPSLKITAQGGLNSIKATDWFSIPASLFGNLAGGLTQPVFNRRSIRSAYEQAQHNREAAVHGFRKSVLTAVEEVSTLMNGLEQLRRQSFEVAQRKAAMYKAIEDAQTLYQYGEASYLEVLTVQQSYFQTQLAAAAVRAKEINTNIALYKSLGGY